MKYFIQTFGCQMNKSDSLRIAWALEQNGFQKTEKISQADLILVNMCSVRQSAVDRVYGMGMKFKQIRKRNPKLITILTGCCLENDRKKLLTHFDLIFNINQLPKLFILLSSVLKQKNIKLKTKKILNNKILNQKNKVKNKKIISNFKNYLCIPSLIESPVIAYVPIMTGCNNFCSYCVVPYTRGREKSRPIKNILQEIEELVSKKGIKEIILLGQNVNSYHSGKINFPKLLEKINQIPGKFWITFISSHPKDLSSHLIKTMADCDKICEYLHLAVQSGDNKILKAMNRCYTVEKYLKLIQKVRKKIKELAITTDIIVGFPQETKQQFQNTAKLMHAAKFDLAYIAQYSPRAGTQSAQIQDNILKQEKKRREKVLTEILKKTALGNNQKYLEKTIEVLILKQIKKDEFLAQTRTFKNIKIKSNQCCNNYSNRSNHPPQPGDFCQCLVTKATTWGLIGKFC